MESGEFRTGRCKKPLFLLKPGAVYDCIGEPPVGGPPQSRGLNGHRVLTGVASTTPAVMAVDEPGHCNSWFLVSPEPSFLVASPSSSLDRCRLIQKEGFGLTGLGMQLDSHLNARHGPPEASEPGSCRASFLRGGEGRGGEGRGGEGRGGDPQKVSAGWSKSKTDFRQGDDTLLLVGKLGPPRCLPGMNVEAP